MNARATRRLTSRTEAAHDAREAGGGHALFLVGTHHVIDQSSSVSRLCVLMLPGFRGEVPSDKR
jgi:hypothetical protein